jgi:RNA polymerase-binding transcription factor DksA
MSEPKVDRKNLERRRDEILTELDRVNSAERIELDRDPEEQAIQLEQDQVPVSMEENLRRELDEIEAQLADGGGE